MDVTGSHAHGDNLIIIMDSLKVLVQITTSMQGKFLIVSLIIKNEFGLYLPMVKIFTDM